MQGGGTLGRVLAVGLRIAPRVWPYAVLASAPGLVVLIPRDAVASDLVRWLDYLMDRLAYAALAAALLPSLMRWFADEREPATVRLRDMRRRVVPALAAGLCIALLALPMNLFVFSSGTVSIMRELGRWGLVLYIAALPVVVWVSLRLTLMHASAVVERANPWLASRRSWALTRGRLPTILGIAFLLNLVTIVPGIVVINTLGHGDLNSLLVTLTTGAIVVLLLPWKLAFWAVLYHDARLLVDDVSSRRIAEDAAPL